MHGFGADMRQANFSYAILSHANLHGDFRGANFTHAQFNNTVLSTCKDAINAAVKNPADFWQSTNFSYTNLTKVKFIISDAKLDLSKALLCHTIMPDGSVNNRDCAATM